MSAMHLPRSVSAAAFAAFCLATMASGHVAATEVAYRGVNLAGAEFNERRIPGTIHKDYTYPRPGDVDYFAGKGMNVFRLPFRWERLQPALQGESRRRRARDASTPSSTTPPARAHTWCSIRTTTRATAAA